MRADTTLVSYSSRSVSSRKPTSSTTEFAFVVIPNLRVVAIRTNRVAVLVDEEVLEVVPTLSSPVSLEDNSE
jgi:preprotein translocase subunit SecA